MRLYYYLSVFIIVFSGLFQSALAKSLQMKVTGAYINVHSGPASEFPIFHVLVKNEIFTLEKQQTSWFKVRTSKNQQGWISAADLDKASLLDGSKVSVNTGSFEDYLARDWEFTIQAGALDRIQTMSLAGAWVWTKNLALEGSFSQALGNFADNKLWSLRMRQTLFPDWQLSPYLAVGTGQIRTQPRSNLVQSGAEVRQSNHYEVGLGLEYYFNSSVVLKAEYRGLLVLTDRDEQERLDQWLMGVTIFY